MSSMDRKDSRHLGSEAELPPDRELEQYGVWVKSEPEDVEELEIERDAVDEVLPDIDDTGSLPEIGGLDPDSDRFLSADEERLLDSMDLPEADSSPGGMDDSGGAGLTELGSGVIDIELDDLDAAPRPEIREPRAAPARADSDLEVFSPEDFGVELGPERSDDGSSAADSSSEAGDSFEPIDIDLQFDDTIPSPVVTEADEVSFDLEDIGSSVASGSKGFEEVTEFDDFLGADVSAGNAAQSVDAFSEEAETVEIDLESIGGASESPRRAVASAVTPAAAPSPSSPAASAGHEDLPELVLDETPLRDSSFDDLGAVERDLSAIPARLERADSSDLLQRIAEDLAGIRGELVSLKRQLNELKGSGEPARAATSAEHAERAGGFFDEEEDETIALTGDELDNILNTAAFTEETAEGEPVVDASPSEPVENELLPEDGDYSAASGIEEIRLEAGPAGEAADSALENILEEGIQPMTSALEDTTYLEETLENEEPLELDAEPLDDAPLAEPDLDDFDISEEANLLGSGEDLPVLEDADLEHEVSLEDIPFDVPAAEAPSPLGQDLDALEAIPEIEGTSGDAELELIGEGSEYELPLDDFVLEEEGSEQSGINLHEESALSGSPARSIASSAEIEDAAIGFAHPDDVPSSLDEKLFVPEADELSELEPFTASVGLSDFDASGGSSTAAPSADTEPEPAPFDAPRAEPTGDEKDPLRDEVRNVLSYLDKLLDSLPDDKIEEFARSEHFETYKRLFEELGLA